MKQDFLYETKIGNEIALSLYTQGDFGDRPCVLILHGFKGFKDWGFFPYSAQYLAQRGIDAVTMNFSHNGIKGHGEQFNRLELFENNTVSLEVDEAREIIQLLMYTDFLGKILKHELGLIGHSRGGGVALLAGRDNPNVKAMSTWAAVSTFDRYEKEEKQQWKRLGYREVLNSRTGQTFRVGKKYIEDIDRNSRNHLNILEAVKNFHKPLLIIHGHQDETIPMYEAEQMNVFADPDQTLFRLIPDTGHTFDAKHPFDQSNPHLDLVLSLTHDFFANQLS